MEHTPRAHSSSGRSTTEVGTTWGGFNQFEGAWTLNPSFGACGPNPVELALARVRVRPSSSEVGQSCALGWAKSPPKRQRWGRIRPLWAGSRRQHWLGTGRIQRNSLPSARRFQHKVRPGFGQISGPDATGSIGRMFGPIFSEIGQTSSGVRLRSRPPVLARLSCVRGCWWRRVSSAFPAIGLWPCSSAPALRAARSVGPRDEPNAGSNPRDSEARDGRPRADRLVLRGLGGGLASG